MTGEVLLITYDIDNKKISKTTKDLKKLEKETKDVQKQAKQTQVSMKGLGTAFVGVGTAALAAGAAVLAFGAETLRSTRELQKAITMSGVQAEAFQRQAIAAKSVGIEQDKLGDIYKDVNDKLGDFVTTGAGPLVDFFDGIGKKVGVTIDDFKDLSGDQALGLFVKTLEDANVSQAEMTFHMEALASDSVLLAPLLANNAAEMTRLGEAAGTVLSQEQIDNAGRLNEAFDAMSNTIGNQLKGAFIDVATEAANFFGLLDTQAQKTAKAAMASLDDQVADLQESLRQLADNEIDSVAQSYAELNNIGFDTNLFGDDAIDDADRLRQILETQLALKKQAFFAQSDILGAVNEQIKAQQELAETARSGQGLGTGVGTGLASVKQLQEEEAARVKNEAAMAKEAATLKAKNKALADEKLRFEQVKAEMGLVHDFALVHKQDLQDFQALLATGAISAERYAEEIKKLAEGDDESAGGPFEGLIEELNSIESIMAETVKGGINDMSNALTDMVVSGKADFAGLAKSILSDIASMIIKMLILKAVSSFLPGADKGLTVTTPTTADHGGSARAGQPVLIGTGAQPELFQPTTAGRFVPKQQLAGMFGGNGGTVFNITSNVTVEGGGGGVDAEQAELISKTVQREIKVMAQQVLINEQRPGNILNPSNVHDFR